MNDQETAELDDEYLDDVLAWWKASSPGQWRTGTKVHRTIYDHPDGGEGHLIGVMDRWQDAGFVANAHHDVPFLVDGARRQLRELERLREFKRVAVEALIEGGLVLQTLLMFPKLPGMSKDLWRQVGTTEPKFRAALACDAETNP